MAVSPIDLVLLVMFVPVVALLAAAPVRGRAWSGSWLLVVGALYVPLFEDGFLATWLAMAPPTVDPHGVAGLVEPHAQGHMLGAGVATIVLSVLSLIHI